MPFCSKCGTDIETAKFCSNCGMSNSESEVGGVPLEKINKTGTKKEEEKEPAAFNDGFDCRINLTTERIYAKSIGLEETYALRSVDGIGVYDDLDTYKEEKLKAEADAKLKANAAIMAYFGGGLCGLLGLWILTLGEDLLIFGLLEILVCFGLMYLGYDQMEKSKNIKNKPTLKSYVKIIISGNNKLYLFNKKSKDSSKVADFVNKVEDTLTKYV
jgi:hypothetical protein